MYLEFFGLRELPFALPPDTDYLIELAGHRRALASVLQVLESGETLIKITGEVGAGKTLLLRRLQERLGPPWFIITISNPFLTPDGLMLAVAEELGLPVDANNGRHHLLGRIEAQLRSLRQTGFKVVLLVDEAQTMPDETLEALRLLTNLEYDSARLLQLVLAGSPALDARLQQDALRPLQQRISHSAVLPPLETDEVAGYVNQRLARAGLAGHNLFSRAAIEQLYAASGGIPRLINVLAHKAMLVAYGRGDTRIGPGHVRRALDDVGTSVVERPAATSSVRKDLLQLLLAAFTGSVITIVLVLLFFWLT